MVVVVGVVVDVVDDVLDELLPQPRNVRVPSAESSSRIIFLPDMIDLVS